MAGQTVNKSQLAAFLGHDVNTIDSYVRQGMPFISKADRSTGKTWEFDTAKVVRWLQDRAAKSSEGEAAIKMELAEAHRRRAVAEAQMAELELAKKREEVVNYQAVLKAGVDSYRTCAQRLMTISRKLAPQLALETDMQIIQTQIDTEIYQALDELGRYDPVDLPGGTSPDPGYGVGLEGSTSAT